MGLPPEAIAFLKENEIPEKKCECCGHCERVLEEIGHYVGMFEDEYPFYRHQLKDGRFADEFLQSSSWSSGPCFFLGLEVRDKDIVVKKFEWKQSVIDAA